MKKVTRILSPAQGAMYDALTMTRRSHLPAGSTLEDPKHQADLLRAEMAISGREVVHLVAALKGPVVDVDGVGEQLTEIGERLQEMAKVGAEA